MTTTRRPRSVPVLREGGDDNGDLGGDALARRARRSAAPGPAGPVRRPPGPQGGPRGRGRRPVQRSSSGCRSGATATCCGSAGSSGVRAG